MQTTSLFEWGFSPIFKNQLPNHADNLFPGRVISRDHGLYRLISTEGEIIAELCGAMRKLPFAEHPAVGDWVLFSSHEGTFLIELILERTTLLYRKDAGKKSDRQLIAANIDHIGIVTGLDNDFNLRRIERYLTIAHESGASPLVILNKSDLLPPEDVIPLLSSVEEIAGDAQVLLISSLYQIGLEALHPFLAPGNTMVFVGSSGSGKSTLINTLLQKPAQATGEVRRKDSHGRHTTTNRYLFKRAEGGLIIDTPGLREIQLLASADSLAETFSDIDLLAADCKFKDCTHSHEPGCAVIAALENGDLDEDRYLSFQKLQSEINHHDARYREKRQKWEKECSKFQKRLKKYGKNSELHP